MRILHLFANYKWTGPADPAMRCAAELRRLGCDVSFAQAEWTLPGAEHRMAIELRQIRMPVIAGLELRKHFHVASLLRDARGLRARLDRGDFDVVHAHLLADHLIAAIAKRRAARRPVLVRSYYEPESPKRSSWRERVALRYTDGVVAPTDLCARGLERRFGLAESRRLVQDPPVPLGDLNGEDLRGEFGVDPDHFLIGITARIQPHRRFELLWRTLRRLVDARPHVRLVLLGRGNERDTEELVRGPVRELGLEGHVVLPGYLYGSAYFAALRGLDAFLFLVPGSDGTCRAVREAMAHGVPVVTTRRGILPELCAPAAPGGAPAGIPCDESPVALAAALTRLVDDGAFREEVRGGALTRVRTRMDPERAAVRLLGFYESLRGSS